MTDLYDDGLKVRKEVLGAAYVDKSLASADEFMMTFQEHVTKYCWGAIWSRDGLDRKTRSIVNLAMLSSLHRGSELKLHVRGALNNGVTPDEIKEIFLQVAVYAGVPAGLESFKIAHEVMAEAGVKTD